MTRTSRCTLAAGLATGSVIALSGPAALAADHREAPIIQEDLPADINDVFAFLSPDDPGRLVLAMTVNPFSVPSENVTYNFSPNVRYAFNVDSTGDAWPDVLVRFEFTSVVDGPQTYEVIVEGADDSVAPFSGAVTLPSAESKPNPPLVTAGPAGITAFAGQRDDPFFFDVVGFQRFLAGTGGFTGSDGFAGANVSAIVVEVPLDLVTVDARVGDDDDDDMGPAPSMMQGDGVPLQIWGTTERRRKTVRRSNAGKLEVHVGPWRQVDRMGNPAVNTALVPLAEKDLFNIGRPSDDAGDFAASIVASLQALGTNDENIGILASVAVPDTLKLDPRVPSAFPNGRAPSDDVVDTLFFFIFNQVAVSDGVDANDAPFSARFPYLAPPHQPE